METDSKNVNKINCFQCIYFSVTWEPTFPKTCKLFGFKSVKLPSAIVKESTGAACLGFVAKGRGKEKSPPPADNR